jgi:hypothetical protein
MLREGGFLPDAGALSPQIAATPADPQMQPLGMVTQYVAQAGLEELLGPSSPPASAS